MRKILSIIAFLIILTGGVFAAYVAGLFPDSILYPRFPQGNGTIGGAIAGFFGGTNLSTYNGDGTVNNATALGGVTATGYLRSSGNCGTTKVWTSVAGGIPSCGDKSGVLAMMGSVDTLSGTATVYHANGTFEPITSGTGILEGDIIKTDPGSTTTIAFADYSILRVGPDSTVSLDTGTASGSTMAYAILENGSLWGRVLTETGGYYIGRDDLIVGVRGTAVAFTQSNPTAHISAMAPWRIIKTQSGGIGSLMILQSTSTGVAGTIRCRDTAGIEHDFDVMTGVTIPFGVTLPICPSPGVRTAMNSLYTTNTGITENTLADLDYMSGVLAIPGLSPTKIARIRNEFAVTEPTTLTERDAICPDNDGRKILWPSLLHTHIEKCQKDNVLAVASFTGVINDLDRRRLFLENRPALITSSLNFTPSLNGASITANGQYLLYDTGSFGFNLGGKEIEMIVEGGLTNGNILIDFTGNPSPPNAKYRIHVSGTGFDCKWLPLLTPGSGDDCVSQVSLGGGVRKLHFVVPNTVEIVTFGNWPHNVITPYNKPIGGTIRSIRILD